MRRYLLLCLATPLSLFADELKIAVAANFQDVIRTLAPEFERSSGHKLVPVFGSTGKFYLQIKHAAPFEVFLAADVKHPRLLESEGLAVPGTRFTYAIGKIVLWSAKENFIDAEAKVLEGSAFKYLAIANPDVAPYGRAAKEYLTNRKLWDALQGRITMGQDIGQTYHFVNTGNAELGFIALSQVQQPGRKISGSYFLIPSKQYKPLEQQAIKIKENRAANAFLEFLKSPAAKRVIQEFGYEIP